MKKKTSDFDEAIEEAQEYHGDLLNELEAAQSRIEDLEEERDRLAEQVEEYEKAERAK